MDKVNELLREWNFDRWADVRALASIRALANGRARSAQLFSHMVEAKILWFLRLSGEYQNMRGVWNNWDLDECAGKLGAISDQWIALTEKQTVHSLAARIIYKNSQEKEFSNSVEEIIRHVLYHSMYHRGQIAMEVRKAGGTPAQTDYITFCRE